MDSRHGNRTLRLVGFAFGVAAIGCTAGGPARSLSGAAGGGAGARGTGGATSSPTGAAGTGAGGAGASGAPMTSGAAGSTGTGGGAAGAPGAGGAPMAGTGGSSSAGAGGQGGGSGGADAGSSAGRGGSAGGGSAGAGNTGDIAGKITVGFQGWFTAANDGSGINPPWWHWTADRNTPSASDISVKSWPDMSEYATTYPTDFPNLGSGHPAALYSNWDASTIDTQVKWMQDAGIDTIALQRFGDYRGTGEARNVVAGHLRDAAEAHGRKFYVMYDITGWTTFQDDLKSDWTTHIVGELNLLSSPAYAKQDGKPVVAIWAIGYSGSPGTAATQLDVINYFQGLGMYVIGGVGNDWRTADGTRWARAGFGQVFDALDAVSPWMVGVIGDEAGSDSNRTMYNEGDVTYLHGRGKRYQPCVLPGDLQERQRHHGDFMWHQLFNMVQIGADGLYISMYDEFNEGNQIAKTSPTTADVPAGSGFLSLDEDGTACSSDYYLRLTGDGGKMLKGQMPLTSVRPTSTM